MLKRKILCAALLASALLLTACHPLHKVTFDQKNDTYTDEKTNVVYHPLPSSFEPEARGEEYASLKIGKVSYTLYEIVGQDPEAFLCTEYGDVYCKDPASVPTFESFTPSGLSVCLYDAVGTARMKLSASNAGENDLITSLADAYRHGTAVARPIETPEASYILRFSSEECPGVLYSLRYYEYAQDVTDVLTDEEETEVNFGKYFLYNLYENRCVPVGAELHALLEGNE